jgi:hypothetical protein
MHPSGMVNSMVSITVTGDHDWPEWLIRISGICTDHQTRKLASTFRL